MTLPSFTKVLLKAKKEKKLSFEDLGKLINRDEVWVASLFYGQATASQGEANICLLYTSPSPRDATLSRMPSSA